jgi:hypothetical protein
VVNSSREDGRRLTWTLSVWVNHSDRDAQEWAGVLESAGGQRWDFGSLDELDRLICELGGWIDPPTRALESRNSPIDRGTKDRV